MRILLTNDDGIYAPGLAAMRRALERLGEVDVAAPAVEQSGVGHSITFLTPLMAKEVFVPGTSGEERIGWAVEGSPADCVKLAVAKLCPEPPDLVVSGMNGGLNVGVNVLYSGTVAAATEAALQSLPSIAVSLEYEEHPRFEQAADIATQIIEQMLERNAWQDHLLYNLNVPTSATLNGAPAAEIKLATMSTSTWGAEFTERRDPKDRRYFWSSGQLPIEPTDSPTDLAGIQQGQVTLTPLTINRTNEAQLTAMAEWKLSPSAQTAG